MKRMVLLVMLAAAGVMIAVACGPSFEDVPDPEFSIEHATNERTLSQVGPRDRDTTMPSLSLRNSGRGDLEIRNFEWISRPDRLNAYYEGSNSTDGGTCSSDADCGSEAFCITASGSCRDLGFAETPIEVRPDRLHNIPFVVTASDQAVQCPEPHSDVPEQVRDIYCGELLIETNANNSTNLVEDGNARIYFVTDGSSGLLELSESFLRFTEVTPGGSSSRSFSINNNEDGPLTVERAEITTNSDWFEISPGISNNVISGHGAETYTLHLNPPADASPEDLEFDTSIRFPSSSVGPERAIFVEVTAGIGDVPLIEVDPMQLSFADSTEQTMEIQNHGGGALIIQNMSVQPSAVAEYYSVYHNGQEILRGDGSVPNIAPATGGEPTVEEVTVEFTAPADETISTVGTLEINHSDTRTESPLRVMLLGDADEIALGEIATDAMRQVRMVSDGGPQVRHLPLINSGTSDLIIDDVQLEEGNSNTDAEDYTISGLEGTIAPGEIKEITIEYAGDSQFAQDLDITTVSNHGGQPSTMALQVTAQAGSASSAEVTITPSFSTDALVGENTTFEVGIEGGEANLNNAQWLTLQRPAGSEALVQVVGSEASFVPDMEGTYRVSVSLRDTSVMGSPEVQEIIEFQASE